MTLVAHCIGLKEEEVKKLQDIKSRASIRIISQNGLTVVNARGIYDDLMEIVAIITNFHTFEINLQ